MQDKRVVAKIATIINSMTATYSNFIESGIHGTARSGVFYMIFRCPITNHYLCFQWHIDERTVRFSQVLSNLHLDEAREYSASLFRIFNRIRQNQLAKENETLCPPN